MTDGRKAGIENGKKCGKDLTGLVGWWRRVEKRKVEQKMEECIKKNRKIVT